MIKMSRISVAQGISLYPPLLKSNRFTSFATNILFSSLRTTTLSSSNRGNKGYQAERIHVENLIPIINKHEVDKIPLEFRKEMSRGLKDQEDINLKNALLHFEKAKEVLSNLPEKDVEWVAFADSCIAEVKDQMCLVKTHASTPSKEMQEEVKIDDQSVAIRVQELEKTVEILKNHVFQLTPRDYFHHFYQPSYQAHSPEKGAYHPKHGSFAHMPQYKKSSLRD